MKRGINYEAINKLSSENWYLHICTENFCKRVFCGSRYHAKFQSAAEDAV